MTTPNLPIGATNSGTNDWSDVHGEDQAIVDAYNTDHQSGGHPGSWLQNATVTDAKLASPNNSVYRTLVAVNGIIANVGGTGVYLLGSKVGSGSTASMVKSGANLDVTQTAIPPELFYFDDADCLVGSLTQKLRLRCQVACNATAPTASFTFGLYPVTVAGGANLLVYTVGSVVSSSTQLIATPSASTVTPAVNSDFTVPADGAYVLGVATDAFAANAAVSCHAQLQTRNV